MYTLLFGNHWNDKIVISSRQNSLHSSFILRKWKCGVSRYYFGVCYYSLNVITLWNNWGCQRKMSYHCMYATMKDKLNSIQNYAMVRHT